MKCLTFCMRMGFIFIILICCSCGGTKKLNSQTSNSNPYGVAVEADICQELQAQNPAVRSWGNGQHFKLSVANNIAEAQARAKFARAISSAILDATEEFGISLEDYAGDSQTGNAVADQSAGANNDVLAIANEIVNSTVVIKTSTYMLPNRQYNVFVCLEYKDGLDNMTNKVVDKVKNKISDGEAKKIYERRDQFNERIKNILSK